MSDFNGVFTGSSGNRLVDFCDHYLTFGRRHDAIYRRVEDSKLIEGVDLPENQFLMILRISSWAIVIFPLIAAVVRWCLKDESLKGKNLVELKLGTCLDYTGSEKSHEVRHHRYLKECLKLSAIDQVAYKTIYPFVTREGKPQLFFASDSGPYYSQPAGPDYIGLLIRGLDSKSFWIEMQLNQSKEFDMPICILSPRDAASVFFSKGREFSRAFKQVLTQQI